MERNSVGSGGSMFGKLESLASMHEASVFVKEKQSLDALRIFISTTLELLLYFIILMLRFYLDGSCEMLGLWKILCEHQFHVIAACLPPEQQAALLAASFRELLLGGQEVAGLLILSLINQYLLDNASVDSISSELREVCPNLYRNEDAACSKVLHY